MPTYDYDCAACGRRFEVLHGVYADGPTTCPLCGKGPVRKAVSAPAVHFKGSGWAKKERHAAPSKAGAASGSSGDAPSAESTDGAAASKERDTSSATSGDGPEPAVTKKTDAATSDKGVGAAKPTAD